MLRPTQIELLVRVESETESQNGRVRLHHQLGADLAIPRERRTRLKTSAKLLQDYLGVIVHEVVPRVRDSAPP